jgi:hypothetical protein
MKLIGVKIAMAGFCEHGSKNVVSIKCMIFLNQFRVLSFIQKGLFSMDTEDKSIILDFSLQIHSADHMRRYYNTNWFL